MKPDSRDEKTDTRADRKHEGLRHDSRKPLTKTKQRENEEDPPAVSDVPTVMS